MNLCDHRQIQAMLQANGFHFSKSKGQNFLTAPWVPERIAEEAGLDRDTGVAEIGPGVGCLTEQLALRAGKVVAFEVDELLRPVLGVTMHPYDNVEVVFGDVMRRDLKKELEERMPGLRHVLCANLPYNITTPVLTQIYQSRAFDTVTVMVQKEVAQRICAQAGEKDYGAFSILTRWYGEPELLFTVGPECFVPQPKVQSAVVRIRMREKPPVEAEEKAFFAVVRAAFNQRRKTLQNALNGLCSKEKAAVAIAACGFSPTVRGEALTLEDFGALTRALGTEPGSV